MRPASELGPCVHLCHTRVRALCGVRPVVVCNGTVVVYVLNGNSKSADVRIRARFPHGGMFNLQPRKGLAKQLDADGYVKFSMNKGRVLLLNTTCLNSY